MGHLHPEESASKIEALERELSETREVKERQEEIVRELQDELEKQCVSYTIHPYGIIVQYKLQQSSHFTSLCLCTELLIQNQI